MTRMIEWEGELITRKQFKELPRCEQHMGPTLKLYQTRRGLLCKSCISWMNEQAIKEMA